MFDTEVVQVEYLDGGWVGAAGDGLLLVGGQGDVRGQVRHVEVLDQVDSLQLAGVFVERLVRLA